MGRRKGFIGSSSAVSEFLKCHAVVGIQDAVVLDVLYNLVHIPERQPDAGVRRAVIDGNTPGVRILNRRAGEEKEIHRMKTIVQTTQYVMLHIVRVTNSLLFLILMKNIHS